MRKTAYVRKILFVFCYRMLKYIAFRGKIWLLNQVQILDDQLANCDHEFILRSRKPNDIIIVVECPGAADLL
jgi:hypothetical protein